MLTTLIHILENATTVRVSTYTRPSTEGYSAHRDRSPQQHQLFRRETRNASELSLICGTYRSSCKQRVLKSHIRYTHLILMTLVIVRYPCNIQSTLINHAIINRALTERRRQ